jgi:hypothetical protein
VALQGIPGILANYKIDTWIFQKNYQALNRVICIAQEKYLKMHRIRS